METEETNNIIRNEKDIVFKYKLDGAGWSNAYLKIGDAGVVFNRISYLGYPVTDLLSALHSIIEEDDMVTEKGESVKIRDDAFVFTWDDEPGGYEWQIDRKSKNKMHVVIKSIYEDVSSLPKYGEIVLNKVVDFRVFTTVIVREIDRIVKEFGLLGFRANWINDNGGFMQFPLSSFLRLKYYLLYNKVLWIQLEGKTENWSLKEEIDLLDAEV